LKIGLKFGLKLALEKPAKTSEKYGVFFPFGERILSTFWLEYALGFGPFFQAGFRDDGDPDFDSVRPSRRYG